MEKEFLPNRSARVPLDKDSGDLAVTPADYLHLEAKDNLLQSGLWAAHKKAFGWQPKGFLVEGHPLIILCRKLPKSSFDFAYAPHGPDLPRDLQKPEILGKVSRGLKPYLSPGTIFIRYDLPWKIKPEIPLLQDNTGVVKAPGDIQPPDTVFLNLEKPEEDLLSGMKQKTRYNLRLAEKRGVIVREEGREKLPVWYDLYRETSERDRITIHPEEYYSNLFDLFPTGGVEGNNTLRELKLYLAYYEEIPIAGIIVSHFGTRATYLYGASSNTHRNLMSSYLLQWEALRAAKARGCKVYDLFGIPPKEDPAHPMYGLYRFKTGFGGEIIHYYGCYDVPYRKTLYKFYSWAEKLRLWYFRSFRKR